jgi:hypothetical protein
MAAVNARGKSANPQLMIFAASLALWVMIIGSCSMIVG